jgi:hypothetical protein
MRTGRKSSAPVGFSSFLCAFQTMPLKVFKGDDELENNKTIVILLTANNLAAVDNGDDLISGCLVHINLAKILVGEKRRKI